ncbi:MAG: hypothetical protein ABW061_28230 [Polyangiaceae bacterium]
MNIGVVKRVLGFGLLGLVAVACGGSDAPNANCGTAQQPKAIEIKDVSPAAGASVKNSVIVQSFTIVGQHLQIETNFGLPAAHTAGQSVPTPLKFTIAASGADTVYTSDPFSWQNAPAHVEIDSGGLLETNGCISALPEKLFEYDVTAP